LGAPILSPGNAPFEDVNTRIDRVIREHGSKEQQLRGLLVVMFTIGIAILIYGIVERDRYLIGLSIGVNGLMCWPLIRLERLYRRTIALAVVPQITALLSPQDARREIHALIQRLLE
jgi:hypothetical protein